MNTALKTINEINELIHNYEKLKEKYDDLITQKLSIEHLSLIKDKKIREQESLINSQKNNIKGLQKSIVRLNKSIEIEEVTSSENKLKTKISELEFSQKELLIKINRLQNKNNSLSVKNIKKEKVINELTQLIKKL